MNIRKLAICLIILVITTVILMGCSDKPLTSAQPQPGATLSGAISIKKADSGQITLKVSTDGQMVESISLSFTNIDCGGFSAGSTSSMASVSAEVKNGQFDVETTNFGRVNGQFTTPTSAQGKLYLAFFEGKAACGTWDWSASAD